MNTKLARRVIKASEVLYKHKELAFPPHASPMNCPRSMLTVECIKKYLWYCLDGVGLDSSQMSLMLIDEFVDEKEATKRMRDMRPTWKKLTWKIISTGFTLEE